MKPASRITTLAVLLNLLLACTPIRAIPSASNESSTNTPIATMDALPTSTATAGNGSDVILQRSDLARSGVFKFPAIRQLPSVTWQADFGDLFMGTPLLADNVLYSGGSDGSLYAIDATNGDLLWSAGGFEVIETAIAIAGEMIIGGGGNNRVQALDRRDGHVVWTFQTSAPIFTAPLIVSDTVFVATFDKLHALNVQTGKANWQTNIGAAMTYVSPPAFAANTIYVAVGPKLLAYEAATGQVRWTVESKAAFWGLVLASDLVVVGNSDGYLHAYEQATGAERWQFASRFGGPNEIWSSPAAAEEMIYVGSRDQYVYALEIGNGQKIWEFKTAGDSVGDPVVSDGVLYVSDSNHYLPPGRRRLHALDAATGQELWTYEVNSTLLTTPALGPDAVYVTITGAVIALQ